MFNISKEISIVDDGLLTLEKNKILDNIFDYYYSDRKNIKLMCNYNYGFMSK